MNRRLAVLLRHLADRIDHAGAPKLTHWSFTSEQGAGLVFNQEHRGCPVACLGDGDYARAHDEAHDNQCCGDVQAHIQHL